MKKFLVSYYFRQRGGSGRSGGYLGDHTGYGNTIWECENLPQNNEEIHTLEKNIADNIRAFSVKILAISPLQ